MMRSKAIGASLCTLLFLEGFILMGFEMLASRFMNPYFGSSIETWACIISVVLVSMAAGYFVGGYLSAQRSAHIILPIVTAFSGAYLICVSWLASDVLLWIIVNYEVGFWSTLSAALALLGLPVFFMSFWSPIMVGLLARVFSSGSSTAGYVYGVSTIGNVFGTLTTAFVLVPAFGSSTISLIFGVSLLFICLLYYLLLSQVHGALTAKASVGLGVFAAACTLAIGAEPASAQGDYVAHYPEGVFIESEETFFFTEMTANRINKVVDGRISVFHEFASCGPTGITQVANNRFAVACHLTGQIAVLTSDGGVVEFLMTTEDGYQLRNPNDINMDGSGGAFFSDPGPFSTSAGRVGRVFFLSPELNIRLVADTLTYPNGVAFDGSSSKLLVSEHLGQRIVALTLDAHYREVGNRAIALDFAKEAKLRHWDPYSGPDGLRLLPQGGLAVALYGQGTVAVFGRCEETTWITGFPTYTTSVGLKDGLLVVAGAASNRVYPFEGAVVARNIEDKVLCQTSAD